jgi:hypothetical protein
MKWLMSLLLVTACTLPAMFPGGGKTQVHQEETSKTSRTEEINGKPVHEDEDPIEPPAELAVHHKKAKRTSSKEVEATTCHTNADCDSKVCFTGKGDLGYCTKMCNSFSDCPSFWECEHVGNAPQKICMQEKD